MEQTAVVLDKRFEHVSYQACYEEGEQHILEQVNKPEYAKYDKRADYHAYHTVKRIGVM